MLKPGNALVKSHSTLNGREKTFLPAGRAKIVTRGKISHVSTSKLFNEKEKNYSKNRVTCGSCVEILNLATAFRRALEFYSIQTQFKSDQQRRHFVAFIFKGFSPSVHLWFVAGSMWLRSRTQAHSCFCRLAEGLLTIFREFIAEKIKRNKTKQTRNMRVYFCFWSFPCE